MARINRRSGHSLVALGLLGVVFFWITDPRYGMALQWHRGGDPVNDNPIYLANQQLPGTIIGLVGSLLILVIGIRLLSRKSV